MNNGNGTLFAPSSVQTKEREKRRSPLVGSLAAPAAQQGRRRGNVGGHPAVVVAVLAPVLAPYDPNQTNIKMPSRTVVGTPPGDDNSAGHAEPDHLRQQDLLLCRLRRRGIGAVFGGILGAIGGYYGGRLDNFIMRCMDVLLAIPQIILALPSWCPGNEPAEPHDRRGDSHFPVRPVVRASPSPCGGRSTWRRPGRWERATPGASGEHPPQTAWPPSSCRALWEWPRPSFRRGPLLPRPRHPAPHGGVGSMLSSGRQFLRTPLSHLFSGLAISVVVLALNIFGDGFGIP